MNARTLKIIFSIYFSIISLVLITLTFLLVRHNTSTFISLQGSNLDSSAETSSQIIESNKISVGLNDWQISNVSKVNTNDNADQFKEAMISIDVDDGWISAYDNAFPIFDKYGFKATSYIITGDSSTKSVYINYEQVKNLQKRGHSIQSHTVSHPFLTKLSQVKAESEIKNSANQLESILGVKAQVLATPYCDSNNFIKETAKKYYQLMRNCDQTVNNTKKNLDPYNLKAKVVLNSTTLDQYKAWINEAIEKKEWIILMYHRIGDGASQYSVDTNTLEEQMKFLKSKTISKESKILPTLEAYNYLIK